MKPTTLPLLVTAAAAAPNILAADNNTTALERRDGWKYCGIFATGDRDGARRLARDIGSCTTTAEGGYGTEFKVSGTSYIDPLFKSSCWGIGCDEETWTQVWICNDNTYDITKSCTEVAHWMDRIIDECCADSAGKALSGQYFLGDGTNIDIAWGRCLGPTYPTDGGEGHGQCKG